MYDRPSIYEKSVTALYHLGNFENCKTCTNCQTIYANQRSWYYSIVLRRVLHKWFESLFKFYDSKHFNGDSMQYQIFRHWIFGNALGNWLFCWYLATNQKIYHIVYWAYFGVGDSFYNPPCIVIPQYDTWQLCPSMDAVGH